MKATAIPQQPSSLEGRSLIEQSIDGFAMHLEYVRLVSPHTRRNYLSDLRQFSRMVGPARLEDVNAATIRAYLKSPSKSPRKRTSVARKLASLRTFFDYLVAQKAVKRNPARQIAPPGIPKKFPQILTVEEVEKLLNTPDTGTTLGKRDRAILELLYASAIKVGELVNLNMEDLDVKDWTVSIAGRRRRPRTVLFGSKAAEALRAYLAVRSELIEMAIPGVRGFGKSPVFPNYQGGRVSARSIGRMIDKYVAECGVANGLSPYTLRHSCATHMMLGGADLVSIQELLGHARTATTRIYEELAKHLKQ